jgi:hypothetical protein
VDLGVVVLHFVDHAADIDPTKHYFAFQHVAAHRLGKRGNLISGDL